MYAIIETGGKQVKVEKGQTIFVEKLNGEVGETVTFDKVLFIGDDKPTVGNPLINGATVTGTVEKQGKDKKIIVFKYKAKKNYHKKQGHRQPYTKVVIDAINLKGAKPAAPAKVEASAEVKPASVEKKPAEKKPAATKATAEKKPVAKKPATAKATTAEKKPAAKKATTEKVTAEKKPAAKKTTAKKED